jgi:uncharacterized protein YdgA (DUF945 family)
LANKIDNQKYYPHINLLVKKALVLTTLSAALLVSFPASAADPVQPAAEAAAPKAAKKPQSDMLDALTALGTELKVVIGSAKGNPIPYMDKLVAHEYSAPTKEKLAKVFGSTEPLTIKRSAADGGAVAYTVTAPAFNYLDQDATTFSWSELGVNLLIDKAGQNMTSNGSWSNFSVAEKSMTMTVSDMSLESKQRRSTQNIWLGTAHVGVGKMAFTPAAGPGVVMEGLTFASNVTQHAKAIDIGYESQIKSVKVLGESVDDIRFAMRMLNIDMRALEKMTEAMADAEKAGINKEQRLAMIMDQFKLMGKSAALRGTSVEIDDFSLGFHGNRAVIKGKVSLLKGTDADFASAAKFANKVVARLQVRVPLVLVSDIAKTVMTKEAEGKGEKPSAEGIAQAAQSVTDVIVGKVITGGYAKLEAGMLVSLIEFKGGKLSFNGKEVSLPKGPTPPAKPVEAAKPADAAK